jgi:hypothetical protein
MDTSRNRVHLCKENFQILVGLVNQMLTVLHPELLPLIYDIPVGLIPFWLKNGERPKLVIKVPKEMILAAKINQGFRIYAAPIVVQGKNTLGFLSAFFDDEDEPLVIWTLISSGNETLLDTVLCSQLDIYFFDVNNRELLGYTADLSCESTTRSFIEKIELLPYDFSIEKLSMDQMTKWFGMRSVQDDLSAIFVKFTTALVPEDLLIQDLLPQNHSYHGSEPFSYTHLVREEPGAFQERDIVQLLHRIFSPEQIYLGPLRVTDREEIADVLVATDSHLLLIQAKDSPNTEQVAKNTMSRKKATTIKSLRKAVDQTRGAVRYARSGEPMRMIIGGKEIKLRIEGRKIRTLIIVKELFFGEYSAYSNIVLPVAEKNNAPCIVLDYAELHMYSLHLRNEESFFNAYDRVFMYGAEHGIFPRLRFIPPSAKKCRRR